MAFTRAMSRELGDDGIRVNTLTPGFTLSELDREQNPGHVETARDRAIARARSSATSSRRICSAR